MNKCCTVNMISLFRIRKQYLSENILLGRKSESIKPNALDYMLSVFISSQSFETFYICGLKVKNNKSNMLLTKLIEIRTNLFILAQNSLHMCL